MFVNFFDRELTAAPLKAGTLSDMLDDKEGTRMVIGNVIRSSRKRKNMTQEEMAGLLGISLTAYRELEKGSTNVVSQHIITMAELTNSSSEEIVLGYKPSQIDNSVRLQEREQEFTSRITTLEKRICELETMVKVMTETIDSKNEIILMLKKRLSEDKELNLRNNFVLLQYAQ